MLSLPQSHLRRMLRIFYPDIRKRLHSYFYILFSCLVGLGSTPFQGKSNHNSSICCILGTLFFSIQQCIFHHRIVCRFHQMFPSLTYLGQTTVYFSVVIPLNSLFLVRHEYISSNIGHINCTRKKWFPYVDFFIPVVMPQVQYPVRRSQCIPRSQKGV